MRAKGVITIIHNSRNIGTVQKVGKMWRWVASNGDTSLARTKTAALSSLRLRAN